MAKNQGNKHVPKPETAQPETAQSEGYTAEFRFIVTKPDGSKVIVAASSADEAIAKVQGL